MLSFKDISDLFVKIEQDLIASLKRNLTGHKKWEKSEGFDWPAWQAEKLKHIDAFRRDNKKIMTEYSDEIDQSTRLLMGEQFLEGAHLDEKAEAEGHVREPSEENFFGVNEPRLESLIDDIRQSEQTAEKAALRMMDDVYRRTVYQAQTAMAAGATTLPQAIDTAVKDFLQRGINCIEYKNGARVNIADYVQMALRTAATRSYLQGEAKRRAQLGIDTVLASQYGACSKTCLPWQGRVYIDDVWGEFHGEVSGDRGKSINGKWYPLLSVAVKAGLFHPNCRHTVTTWYEGISKLPDPMNTAKIAENSALERKQRELEQKIRTYKRMAAGLQQPELVKKYKCKTADVQKELRQFIAAHSDVLRRDYWREKAYGVGIQTKAASDFEPKAVPFNKDAIFSIELPGYSDEVNRQISKASKEVVQLGSVDQKEHLILINVKNGRREYVEDSTGAGNVGGAAYFNFLFEHADEKFAFVHNHPSGQMFSLQDVISYFSSANLDSFIAAGHNGRIYAAYGEKKPLPTGNVMMEILSHDNEILKNLRIAKKEGKIDSIDFQHAAERTRVKYMLQTFSNYMEVDT